MTAQAQPRPDPRSSSPDETGDSAVVLHLADGVPPTGIARELGIKYAGPVGELPNHYLFAVPTERQHRDNIDAVLAQRSSIRSGIRWATKLPPKTRLHRRTRPSSPLPGLDSVRLGVPDPHAVRAQTRVAAQLGIADPTFPHQWHLINTVQPGHDLNVSGVWLQGVFGRGVTTAVIDDGLDFRAQDLQPNYYANGSYDLNDDGPEPLPRLADDHHGTLCAAEIAAARNHICGVGVAYRSRVSGIRLLSGTGSVDDVAQARALNLDYQHNDIYSCSWGPEDDGRHMKAPGVLVQRALVHGVQGGRAGKGSIFVFSAGNGASQDDDCNFDGYANSIYSVTVGAMDRRGRHALYSESCAAQLVVTYSSGAGEGIYTTDNADECTNLHSGTSAAAPLAAGVIALALSVRPDLSWRDVQHLLVETAVPVHESDGSWQTGDGHGKTYSHDWGYGKLDAWAVVQRARDWPLVKPQAWLHSSWLPVDARIPEGHQGLSSDYNVSVEALRAANLARLEHVTVTVNVNHTRRGDLSVELVSPRGMVSYLSTPRMPDNASTGYVDWDFMSVAHWGESGTGTWTLIVKDYHVNKHNGTFVNWRLNLWGEAIDGARQPLHPLPGESETHGTMTATMTATMTSESQATPMSVLKQSQNAQPVEVKTTMASSASSAVSFPTFNSRSREPDTLYIYVVICGLAAALGTIALIMFHLPAVMAWPSDFRFRRRQSADRGGQQGRFAYELYTEHEDALLSAA